MEVRVRRFALVLVIAALAGSPAQAADKIVVFAAASLTNAMQDIATAYGAQTHVVNSFASSSTLARQIENGAPAQIFVSADTQWMDYLQKRGLIDAASRKNVVGNALVLIAPGSSPLHAVAVDAHLPWLKLLAGGRLAVGDPAHVPAGIYAKQALQHLGAWTNVRPHLAPAEDVRAALVYVDRGEAPLGIVYRTDALQDPKVKIVGTFPPGAHPPIVYPFALVKGAGSAARAYFAFLTGKTGLAIFAHYGFTHAD
jgi:molybdate transport system substrate-binding protein